MSQNLIFGQIAAVVLALFVIALVGQYLRQEGLLVVPRTSVSNQVTTILPPPTPMPAVSIELVFVGDMMFDRHIRLHAQERGYDALLSPALQQLFTSASLVIGNLEGPVTENSSISVGSTVGSPANYSFTFDPKVVPFLQKHNIRLVNLGNNHILNFGETGLLQTYEKLKAGGIATFGSTGSSTETQRWHATTIDDVSIAFVNYNQFTTAGYEHALADLTSVRADHDVVILYTHWGNEYVPENAVLKQQAKAFVVAGADLIIGSHPHVVTGTELIAGKKVYYSLGNFIFDQYFEPGVQEGLVVSARYDKVTKQFTFQDIPVKLHKNGTTTLKDEVPSE